jgi:hypothetical protein
MTQGDDRACVLARRAFRGLFPPGAYCGSVLSLDGRLGYRIGEYEKTGAKKDSMKRGYCERKILTFEIALSGTPSSSTLLSHLVE